MKKTQDRLRDGYQRADFVTLERGKFHVKVVEVGCSTDRLPAEEAIQRLAAFDAGLNKTYSMDDVLGKD